MILQALFFTTAFWKPCFLFLQFWNVEIEGLIMLGLMSSVSCSLTCGVLFFQVCVDPSGMYVVCSHSDRYMRVYDFATGELLAQASGHAEVITGVTFLPDCRRLISVSSLRRNSSIPLL